jgi:hypothetical protein
MVRGYETQDHLVRATIIKKVRNPLLVRGQGEHQGEGLPYLQKQVPLESGSG